MKGSLFQHEMVKTSAVFGRKNDVQVHFKGDSAYTDGKTIVVPTINALADVSDDQRDVMRGYIDHEAGHIRHSDFEALKEFGVKHSRNKLVMKTHNALEDIWLERRVMKDYPGSQANLRAVTNEVNKTFLEGIDPSDERLAKPTWVGPVALTWEGRKGYGGTSNQDCLDLIPERISRNLPKYIKVLDACENTKDVMALAERAARSFAKDTMDEFEEEEETGKGKSKPCEDGEGGEHGEEGTKGDVSSPDKGEGEVPDDSSSDDESEGTDGSNPSTSDENEGDKSFDDSSGEDPRGGGGVSGGDSISVSDEDFDGEYDVYEDFELSDAVEKAMGNVTAEGRDTYKIYDQSQDKWHSRHGKTSASRLMKKMPSSSYQEELEKVAGSLNVMRRKLERALVATQTRDWEGGTEQGRLDTRRLTRAYLGKPNVFKIRHDRPEMDTAMTILIDLSGSMYGSCAEMAQSVAIALCEAVDRTGVKYEVLGFNNQSSLRTSEHIPYNNSVRHEPLDMYVFKDFNERLFEAKPSMATISRLAGGNNSDGDALHYAYLRLKERNEKRKIFITLSDGYPACAMSSRPLYQHLRDVVGIIEKDGVDVMGIGIMSDSVQQFYPKWVVVNALADLEGAVMDQVGKALMGKRFQVDNSKLFDVSR